jgi:hypothetical protein
MIEEEQIICVRIPAMVRDETILEVLSADWEFTIFIYAFTSGSLCEV